MLYLIFLLTIGVSLIALRFCQALRMEHGVVAVLIFGSVLGHSFYHVNAGGLPVTIDRLFLMALLALSTILVIHKRETWRSFNRSDIVLGLFLAVLTYNTFSSDWQYRDKQPLGQLVFNYFVPLGVYFLARNFSGNGQSFRIFNGGLMVLAAYLAVIAICEVRGWHGLIFPRYIVESTETEFFGRGRGPFLNPVACGIYQMIGLCCGMVWWTRVSWLLRGGLMIYAAVLLAGIFATLTRSVWLATAMTLVLYVWVNSDWRWRGFYLAAAPIALILIVLVAGDRFNSFKRDKNVTAAEMSESIELRPLLAMVATEMILEKPLWGHGFRQYSKTRTEYHFKQTTEAPLQKVLPYVQHNLFLSYAVDIGLIGLLVYLMALGTWITLSVKLWFAKPYAWQKRPVPWHTRQIGFLSLAFLIAFIFNGMFHDVSVVPMLHHLLFALVGMVTGLNAHHFAQVGDPQFAWNSGPGSPADASSSPASNRASIAAIQKA